jgi:hypothetical protein
LQGTQKAAGQNPVHSSLLRDMGSQMTDKSGKKINMDNASLNIVQRILAAYGSQRDDINDSDLDDEQPIGLHIYLSLGDIRRLRMMVILQGKNPADFRVRRRP